MSLTFGEFRLDRDTRQLLRGVEPLHLTPKAFDLLLSLLDSRPKALPKEELLERLWPGTFVAEANLPVLIREIRTVLADDARAPRFVRTVQRYGYAFSGPAAEEPVQATGTEPAVSPWYLVWETRRIPLAVGENRLGRDRSVPIWFDLPGVSRQHAAIEVDGVGATLRDVGSKNGTFLGGERLTAPIALKDGDEIRIGTVRIVSRVSTLIATETLSVSDTTPNTKTP
jgi:DNA-binding winged helix-turn-helix (wHTH) protein